MKLKQFILLGLFSCINLLNAQTDFRPGYIIKLNKDTLMGEIDYRENLSMGRTCRFRKSANEADTVYYPSYIEGYKFKDNKFYVSEEINGEKVFLEFLIKGRISIYYLVDDAGSHYYLKKEGNPIIELPYEEGEKIKNDKTYFNQSTKHIGILNYYMQDAPGFDSKIAAIVQPNHKDLIELVEEYNKTVCENNCIIYQKKLPVNRFNLEILGGADYYPDKKVIGANFLPQFGLLTHVWMPLISENLYFRTGIIGSLLKNNDGLTGIIKIPLQLEYEYPRGNIKPVFAYGIKLYNFAILSGAFMAGLKYKLTQSSSIRLSYDLDFQSQYILFIPERLLCHSLFASFQFKF